MVNPMIFILLEYFPLISGGLLLVCQFILLAIFAFSIPKNLNTTWPRMARTIFYDICLTGMVLIFSGIVRMLAEGKHYTTERPPTRIRNVCRKVSHALICQ